MVAVDGLFPRYVAINCAFCVPLFIALETNGYKPDLAERAIEIVPDWYLCPVPHGSAFKVFTKGMAHGIFGVYYPSTLYEQLGVVNKCESQIFTVCQFDSEKMKKFVFPKQMTTPVCNEKQLNIIWFPSDHKPNPQGAKPGPSSSGLADAPITANDQDRIALKILIEYYEVTCTASTLNSYNADEVAVLNPQGVQCCQQTPELERNNPVVNVYLQSTDPSAKTKNYISNCGTINAIKAVVGDGKKEQKTVKYSNNVDNNPGPEDYATDAYDHDLAKFPTDYNYKKIRFNNADHVYQPSATIINEADATNTTPIVNDEIQVIFDDNTNATQMRRQPRKGTSALLLLKPKLSSRMGMINILNATYRRIKNIIFVL